MSGIFGFTGPPDPDLADRMARLLSHRGGLVGGPLQSDIGTIGVLEWDDYPSVGEVRSCLLSDLPEGQQIGLSGFTFQPLSLPLSVEKLADIRGSHAMAWMDQRGLMIARDSVGTQSLFYGRGRDRWLFATEPKAITAQPEFQRSLRPAAVAQYLTFSFVPGSGTMLDHLWEVQAGHAVELTKQPTPVSHRYFFFESHEHSAEPTLQYRTEGEWIQATRERIQTAVAQRIPSSGERVVFLSGGLDSSIVAAELASQSSSPIRTFSIHFGEKYPNELAFARMVAQRIGSLHEEVLITPQRFQRRLQEMVWHLDEPIGDPITQPNFELAQHVAPYAKGVFNGEGGDPLFGGPKNIPMMLLHWYGGERPANFRQQAYLASYRRAYEECHTLFTDDFRDQLDFERDLEEILTPFFECQQPRSFLNKLMAINIRLKGAHLILPKVDRMLAAAGMVPLSPLFDEKLTELSFAMPPQLKLKNGIEKWILKQAYRDSLPAEIIDRPKSGMRVPVYYWFQKELRRYAEHLLDSQKVHQAGIFKPARIKQLLRYDSESGGSRFGIRLWMLMTFEIWRRNLWD